MIHTSLVIAWSSNLLSRSFCAHAAVIALYTHYIFRGYYTAMPLAYVFTLSPIPFWSVVFCFTTDVWFSVTCTALAICATLVLEFYVPKTESPWIDPVSLISYYSPAVPVLNVIFCVLFSIHVRYDQFLRDSKLTHFANLKATTLNELSHEMKTPLNGISGALQLIQNSSESVSSFLSLQLSSMSFCVSVISILIQNVLAKEGEAKHVWTSLDIRSFMGDIVSVLQNLTFYKAALSLQLRISEDVPQQLTVAANSLSQILLNLGSNAIKYQESGIVTLSVSLEEEPIVLDMKSSLYGMFSRVSSIFTKRPDGLSQIRTFLVFEVRDRGRGLSDAFVKNSLFRPYMRDAWNVEGTGLGLHISQKLAQSMGGRIAVSRNDVDGVGSIFRVILPLQPPSLSVASQSVCSHPSSLSVTVPPLFPHPNGNLPKVEKASQKKDKGKSLPPPPPPSKLDYPPIYIVDDTMLNIKVMKAMLSQIGVAKTKDFSDGFSFVSHLLLWSRKVSFKGSLADKRHCVCFIDKEMPFLPGTSVIRMVREIEPYLNISVTFIGVTAGEWNDDTLDEMMPKPLKLRVVERVLHKIVHQIRKSNLFADPEERRKGREGERKGEER